MKRCTRCKEHKPLSDFTKRSDSKDGLNQYCRVCCHQNYVDSMRRNKPTREVGWRTSYQKQRAVNPIRMTALAAVGSIRLRTRQKKIPFDSSFVTVEKIEKLLRESPRCAMCGVDLDFKAKGPRGSRAACRDNSPSLDRIIPALGYREGNVSVLCHLCNTRKSNNDLASALLLVEYLAAESVKGVC